MMEIKIIRARRKTISLTINDDLDVVVKAPYGVSNAQIQSFVERNREWIQKALKRKQDVLEKYNVSDDTLLSLKKTARQVIPNRVRYYSDIMGVSPTGIKITAAKKRFGSCSNKNSLCFSYYLMLYPQEAIDYVVVHELAHIKHHNHSKDFYAFIERYMPDYKKREKLLK